MKYGIGHCEDCGEPKKTDGGCPNCGQLRADRRARSGRWGDR